MTEKWIVKHKTHVSSVLLFTIGPALIYAILSLFSNYYGWSIHEEDWDVSNWATLIVEIGIGVILALSIWIYSDAQTRRMSYILEKQEIKEERHKQRILDWISHRFELIKMEIDFYTKNAPVSEVNNGAEVMKQNALIIDRLAVREIEWMSEELYKKISYGTGQTFQVGRTLETKVPLTNEHNEIITYDQAKETIDKAITAISEYTLHE